jgi:hypothetical protein
MAMNMNDMAVKDCNSALTKDVEYSKAILRRARAFSSLKEYTSSIRDYRKYIGLLNCDVCLQDTQRDLAQIQEELNAAIDAQNKRIRADQRRQREEREYEKQRRFQSQYYDEFWDDDDFDFINQFNSQHSSGYQRRTHVFPNTNANSRSYNAKENPKHDQRQGSPRKGHFNSRSSGTMDNDYNKSIPDHYKTLGISTLASDADIRKAYRLLALKYHPDKNKDAGAEDKFKDIGVAYAVLSDKTEKLQYDRNRKQSE